MTWDPPFEPETDSRAPESKQRALDGLNKALQEVDDAFYALNVGAEASVPLGTSDIGEPVVLAWHKFGIPGHGMRWRLVVIEGTFEAPLLESKVIWRLAAVQNLDTLLDACRLAASEASKEIVSATHRALVFVAKIQSESVRKVSP